jgi:hypothetical protein
MIELALFPHGIWYWDPPRTFASLDVPFPNEGCIVTTLFLLLHGILVE